MRIRILSWNVRGVHNVEKRGIIKAFLKLQKVNLICLRGTKLKGIFRGLIRSLGVGRFVDWVASNAVGVGGGILILWNSRVLQLLEVEEHQFSFSCKFQNCEDDFRWVFTGVYDPTLGENMAYFWEELRAIKGPWGDPWVIGEDFNIIWFPEERNRASRIIRSMRRFSQVIDELDMKDIPLKAGLFT